MRDNKRLIIDIHVHPHLSEGHILKEMREAGVDYSVLLGIDTDPMDVEIPEIKEKLRKIQLKLFYHPIFFRPIEETIKESFYTFVKTYPDMKYTNLDIAELVRKHPDKFIGFGSVNPNKDEEYVRTKLREIDELGLKGIKMLPTVQMFNPQDNENFEMICEHCEKNRKIILYHTGCDPGPWEIPELSEDANPKYLEPVLERYKPSIILAHTGSYSSRQPGIWFEEALSLGKKFGNVFFDSSAVGWLIYRDKVIKRIREDVGLERLLYGSDYPVVLRSGMKYEVELIKNCKYLTEEEKDRILGLNAAGLLNINSS